MEVYHCHFEELSNERTAYLLELLAAHIEMRRRDEEAIEKAKQR